MDESLKCECGGNVFWWFGSHIRCQNCFNEMKETEDVKGNTERWMRRFNKEENSYDSVWERF